MDPNATLALIVVVARKIAEDASKPKRYSYQEGIENPTIQFEDLQEISEHIANLSAWIKKGGFVPPNLHITDDSHAWHDFASGPKHRRKGRADPGCVSKPEEWSVSERGTSAAWVFGYRS
jgi:hypothetical protein